MHIPARWWTSWDEVCSWGVPSLVGCELLLWLEFPVELLLDEDPPPLSTSSTLPLSWWAAAWQSFRILFADTHTESATCYTWKFVSPVLGALKEFSLTPLQVFWHFRRWQRWWCDKLTWNKTVYDTSQLYMTLVCILWLWNPEIP